MWQLSYIVKIGKKVTMKGRKKRRKKIKVGREKEVGKKGKEKGEIE